VRIIRQAWRDLLQHSRTDTDFAQSIVRLMIGAATLLIGSWYVGMATRPPEQIHQVQTLSVIWSVLALIIVVSCVKWPGPFWYRRVFAMMCDYSVIGYWLVLGEERAPPLTVLILWVTIGHGMRFGRHYLVLGMGFALITAALTIWIAPYWRTTPGLGVMLILCILVVPLYPFVLLQRTSRAEQMARTANAEKSRYLAQASHDLRQPIHAIGLLAAQLAETGETAQTRDTAVRISRAIHGTTEIVQTFLDVAVIESGTLVAHPEPVALATLFADLEQQMAQAAAWANTELRFVTTSQSVLVDRSFLKAMLQNLISNAIKYAPGSKVLVGCRRRGEELSLFVVDAGRGMSAEHLARIKEPFYRAPEASQGTAQGTGLGLAIVQRLAELADVRFDMLSAPDRGTMAVLHGLQRSNAGASALTAVTPTYLGQLSGTSILLIEDDDETRQATEALLQRWGCVVRSVAAPPAHPGDYDLIVSDFQFADGTKLGSHQHLLREIRRINLPLVMISGSDADEIRAALRPLTPVIIAKPAGPAELRSVLMSAKMTHRPE
jgi:signal transduction histidine kinase